MAINMCRRWLLLFIFALLVAGAGAAKDKEVEQPAAVPPTLAPAQNKRPIMDGLSVFGKLLRVITATTGEHDIIIEIAPILNRSGVEKELPIELSQWVRDAIGKIGEPLHSYEAVPASVQVRPVCPGCPLADRPPHAPTTYRITGVLERFHEREIHGQELEVYIRAGGGNTSADGQFKRTKRATITRLTVSLTLEQPDGLDIATATYFVDILKTEADRNWGLFVSGTGIGAGKTLMIAGDPGDAIFDATAAALVTILGRAQPTLSPYYRCAPIFQEDEAVNELERRTLNRMIPTELLAQKIKPLMFLWGIGNMDMNTPDVTPSDQEQIAAQLRARQLDPADPRSYIQYAYMLWHDVPVAQAADRLEKREDEVVRSIRQRDAAEEEAKARHARAEEVWNITPSRFAWPSTAQIALLDFSQIANPSLRAKIVAALKTCSGCEEVKTDPTGAVVAVRLRSPSQAAGSEQQALKAQAAIEQALRRCRPNVDYHWVGERYKRLYVTPAAPPKADEVAHKPRIVGPQSYNLGPNDAPNTTRRPVQN